MKRQDNPLTEKEVAELTLEGMAALAVRCAMRVLPLFRSGRDDDNERRVEVEALDACVTLSAAFCAAARQIVEAPNGVNGAAAAARAAVARANAVVADAVYAAAAYGAPAYAAATAIGASVYAADAATNDGAAAYAAARRDFQILTKMKLGLPGTNGIPVPRSFFDSPLWDFGSDPSRDAKLATWSTEWEQYVSYLGLGELAHYGPALITGGFPWDAALARLDRWIKRNFGSTPTPDEEDEEIESGSGYIQQPKLRLRATVNERAPTEDVVDAIRRLTRALNKYHVACGGSGLVIDDWDLFVEAGVPQEVLS